MSKTRAAFLIAMMCGFWFGAGWMGNTIHTFKQESREARDKEIVRALASLDQTSGMLDNLVNLVESDQRTYPMVGFGFSYSVSFTETPEGVPQRVGVVVNDILRGSPADTSGIRVGDQIKAIAGIPIGDLGPEQYRNLDNDQIGGRLKPEMEKAMAGFGSDAVAITVLSAKATDERTVRLHRKVVVGQALHDFAKEHLKSWKAGAFAQARDDIASIRTELDEAVKRKNYRGVSECRAKTVLVWNSLEGPYDMYMRFRNLQFVR